MDKHSNWINALAPRTQLFDQNKKQATQPAFQEKYKYGNDQGSLIGNHRNRVRPEHKTTKHTI